MVIKMQRRWNIFSFLSTMYKYLNHVNKIHQLCARILYAFLKKKNIKIWSFVIRRYPPVVGFQFIILGCCKPRTLPKNFYHSFVLRSLVIFFWIDIKNSSSWIVQNILSKEVKQILQRNGGGTGVSMELQKKTAWPIKNILLQIFSR